MDANVVVTQFTSAAVTVWAMQKLKNAEWFPFLSAGRAYLSRTVSVVAAFIAHAGINYTWDPTLDANGYRHLVLAIPTIGGAAVYLWHWLGQFAMQETMYQATLNKVGVTTDSTGSVPTRISPTGEVVVPPPVAPKGE